MSSRQVSRRGVLKTGATLASVGVVGSLSGCSSILAGGDGNDGTGQTASGVAADIPARSNVAIGLHLDAFLEDQAISGAVNDALAEQSTDSSKIPSSMPGALDVVEQKLSADPRKLNEVVLFGESTNSEGSKYVGWLTYTDWTQEKLQSLLEEVNGDFTTETYGGTNVYVSEGTDADTERAAVLSDGTLVFGRGGSVHDVIDLRAGDADPISGQMLAAWNAASGEYATFALDIDAQELPAGQAEAAAPTVENIEYAYGSVYANGDKRGARFNMETESEQAASEVVTFFEGQIALASEQAEDAQTQALLENVDVSRSGTTVSVSTEIGVDTISATIEQFVTLFVAGMERPSDIATTGTSVML